MLKPIVIANWKMNGSLAENRSLLQALASQLSQQTVHAVDIAICPPFPYLFQASEELPPQISLGAQNMNTYVAGAHTGEVSVAMLEDFDCRYVLLGHSERRRLYGETNTEIGGKFELAIETGIRPVLCVGETLEERQRGDTLNVIEAQLNAILDRSKRESMALMVIAYEPVWAIGTGLTASPSQAQEVHHYIRTLLQEVDAGMASHTPLLYGGSVNKDNAADLFRQPDINGALVGGASLKPIDFVRICESAAYEGTATTR